MVDNERKDEKATSISLLFSQRDTQMHRQQSDLISLLLFFKIRKVG
jgi:hypothetical protein